jgi:hypothetical protein
MAGNPPKKWISALIMIFLVALCIALIGAISSGWPPDQGIFKKLKFTMEQHLILLVAISGSLGAFIHAATSFTYHFGVRDFEKSWVSWYLMRPFIGAALALTFYFLLRGGLINVNADERVAGQYSAVQDSVVYIHYDTSQKTAAVRSSADSLAGFRRIGMERLPVRKDSLPVNPFGVMGISIMAGLFSRQAIDKLGEIFENVFLKKEKTGKSKPLVEENTSEIPGIENPTDEDR